MSTVSIKLNIPCDSIYSEENIEDFVKDTHVFMEPNEPNDSFHINMYAVSKNLCLIAEVLSSKAIALVITNN